MKKIARVSVFCVFLIIFNLSYCFSDEIWKDITGNLDTDLYSIAINSQNDNVIYVGSDKAIFKTEDKGKNWSYICTVKGENQKVNFIFLDPSIQGAVYFATANGLFKSVDGGKTIEKIFKGKSGESKEALYLTKTGEGTFYLGTEKGLLVSRDNGASWIRVAGVPQEGRVKSINCHPALPNIIYAVSDYGVYKSCDKGINWERVFIAQSKEEYSSENEEEVAEETEESKIIPRSLLINRYNPQFVYLGTTGGLFISRDSGKTWEEKIISGLEGIEVRYITSFDNPDILYIATNRGVFKVMLDKAEAREIYRDLPARDVRMLALDKEGKVWVVTDKGLFKTEEVLDMEIADKNNSIEEYEFYFRNEPTIREVQEAAIRYAEVNPNKIEQWRKQARAKAFVPTFDLDYDKTIDWYSTQQRYYIGPRSWSMGLSWGFADLVWSTDQTSIDVRSRLMVQLRDDILGEVNRLFFERRRLKLELILEPPQGLKERLNKQLRLEELTAGLDALTGGYFSRRLSELSK